MSEPSYDLTTAPWVRVRLTSGEVTELSLLDTFARAHEAVALAGELPTQDVAMLRLLLAILRRSHSDVRDVEAWGHLWRQGRLDPSRMRAYLDRHRDRFDLLHPQTPFYQVAALSTAKGEMTSLIRLLADVPAGHQYFTTRAGDALRSMGFGEAARWVVHCQAFDPSGIKSGAVGDDRVRGGKGYPIGVAWCGWLGTVVVEGTNLFETLLLNFPTAHRDADPSTDLPVWERPPQTAAVEGRVAPTGPADLLTWQSRRIRLGHDGRAATGVLIANGDPLHPRNMFRQEFMTGWRRSEAQMKALRTREEVFMPRTHQPDRAVWRGLEGLLAEVHDEASTGAVRAGRWLEWLSELRGDEQLPQDAPVRMRAVGMQYGSQSSVTDDIADDLLALSVSVLNDQQVRALAVDGVLDADAAVRALGGLAAELVESAGASGDALNTARSAARERGYAALDEPYRRWLRGLRSDSDRHDVRSAWQREVCFLVVEIARDLIRNAAPAAWIGREVDRGRDRTVYLDAALAEIAFHRRLRQHFGAALNPRPKGDAA